MARTVDQTATKALAAAVSTFVAVVLARLTGVIDMPEPQDITDAINAFVLYAGPPILSFVGTWLSPRNNDKL